ncbi:putative quinol monooxygenase [Microlunatus soli]|uniref:Antibiotic biosynthesis monooxygenase n=1 Tax=Microlunatus soli TaxID=630515 RepID=A0A1H2A707_9ACTN|nr:antibiotic biosynthesis monooxygenase family protein [Microlunatus soli]SDT41758.1 Antibiotic biosynthesis monooxygenase [Microlunatus soli]
MPMTALLDVHFAADHLVDGPALFTEILKDTRSFAGCLRADLLADIADPAHYVAYELWESEEHDLAYRAWRKGDGATNLRDVLDSDPVLTRFETAAQ